MADDAAGVQKSVVELQEEAFRRFLDADPRPKPASYFRSAPLEDGPLHVPVARYISREAHELEKEKLWSRVWQMACHEDDIPKVGDYIPYDIVDKSYLIVRTGPDEFKAYYNACLHRGRKLREYPGSGAKELRCQFHGWTWSLEGKLMQVPCLWDFPGLKREEQALPEVKVGRWGRFVFINPDPDCGPFEDYVGDLSSHFEVLPYERLYKAVHVAKIIRANWKIAHEAFMESYHVIGTHPGVIMHRLDEIPAKTDAFGNYARAIHTLGILDDKTPPKWDPLPDDGILRNRHPLNGWIYERVGAGPEGGKNVRVTTPKGETGLYTHDGRCLEGRLGDVSLHLCIVTGGPIMDPRHVGNSRHRREDYRDIIPSMIDRVPDVEFAAIILCLFPNFDPWGSFNRVVYRFRPNGDDHEEAIMEVIYMAPIPEDGPAPPPPPIHWLGRDDDWTSAPELGGLALLFNQDSANMPQVHAGLKATKREFIPLADSNEGKIRHFHKLYEAWMAKP